MICGRGLPFRISMAPPVFSKILQATIAVICMKMSLPLKYPGGGPIKRGAGDTARRGAEDAIQVWLAYKQTEFPSGTNPGNGIPRPYIRHKGGSDLSALS